MFHIVVGLKGQGNVETRACGINVQIQILGLQKKPINLSVLPEDQGKVYPPGAAPKAPDKGFQHVQEGHRTEVYAPQSEKGATLVNQS
jgi:hypothetical protein